MKAIAQAILDGHHDSAAEARHESVLIIGDGFTELAEWLSSGNLKITTSSDHLANGTARFGACVVKLNMRSFERVAETLKMARDLLSPGGYLALVDEERRDRPTREQVRRRSRKAASNAVERLTALLFREGFDLPRLYGNREVAALSARRSEVDPPGERRQRLSVVMPVFNENRTFPDAINAVLAKEIDGVDIEIILVESNSTDGTRESVLTYAEHPRVKLVLEERPLGKGHAVRRGLQETSGDFVLIQDADLEYSVEDYDALLEPLRSFDAGFVLGVRRSPDGRWGMRHFGERSFLSRLMNVGHVGFLLLFNLVYGRWLHDPFTMYKVVRQDCLNGMVFECDRFDFDWELTGKLIRAGFRPREVTVSYHSRSFSEGKKVSLFGDPLTWVRACFRHRFSPVYEWD